MRQAIEEGFILDVLKYYLSYETYFKLIKKIADDPEFEEKKTKKLLRKSEYLRNILLPEESLIWMVN